MRKISCTSEWTRVEAMIRTADGMAPAGLEISQLDADSARLHGVKLRLGGLLLRGCGRGRRHEDVGAARRAFDRLADCFARRLELLGTGAAHE